MGSVSNCSGVLKHSAATGKINILTTNRTTTHMHNDELRNRFFKNSPGKIASLRKQNERNLIRHDFWKLPKNNYTKKPLNFTFQHFAV